MCLVATGVLGGEVYSIAADKDQARIVFDKSKEKIDGIAATVNALFVAMNNQQDLTKSFWEAA